MKTQALIEMTDLNANHSSVEFRDAGWKRALSAHRVRADQLSQHTNTILGTIYNVTN